MHPLSSDSHQIPNLRRTMMMMRWMTHTGIPHGDMGVRGINHISLAGRLAIKVLAFKPRSGVPLHPHRNPQVSPVHSRTPVDRYIVWALSGSRVAVASTGLARPATQQAFRYRS